jgi:spermidine/putrescine transport system permease protein
MSLRVAACVVSLALALGFAGAVVLTRLQRRPVDLEEAALDLGASRLRVFFLITLPFLATAMAVATAMAGIASMESYTTTLFANGGLHAGVRDRRDDTPPGRALAGGGAMGTVILMLTVGFSVANPVLWHRESI